MARIWPALICASTLGSVELEMSMRPPIEILHQQRRAAIGDLGHLDAGPRHEQLGREVRARADAGRAVVQLAGLGLGQRDHFLDVLGGQIVAYDEDMLEGARRRPAARSPSPRRSPAPST